MTRLLLAAMLLASLYLLLPQWLLREFVGDDPLPEALRGGRYADVCREDMVNKKLIVTSPYLKSRYGKNPTKGQQIVLALVAGLEKAGYVSVMDENEIDRGGEYTVMLYMSMEAAKSDTARMPENRLICGKGKR